MFILVIHFLIEILWKLSLVHSFLQILVITERVLGCGLIIIKNIQGWLLERLGSDMNFLRHSVYFQDSIVLHLRNMMKNSRETISKNREYHMGSHGGLLWENSRNQMVGGEFLRGSQDGIFTLLVVHSRFWIVLIIGVSGQDLLVHIVVMFSKTDL
jgi:hypothetical protein